MHTHIETHAPEPLSRGAFEAALLDAIDGPRIEDSRFYHAVMRGRCSPKMMLRFARSTWLSAELFRSTLAMMIDTAPDREARLVLLENLLEEEGIHLARERGLVLRPERQHPALALRFVRACGGAEGAPGDDAIHATGPGRTLLAEGRWLEGVAYLLIGQELPFAEASQVLFRVLRGAGFSDHDLAFFAVHGVADCAHGRQALNLVLDRAATRADQDRCVAAARASIGHWFEAMGGAARARA